MPSAAVVNSDVHAIHIRCCCQLAFSAKNAENTSVTPEHESTIDTKDNVPVLKQANC